ncbi:MAG: radical SAM protein, partial [Syntrophaceae bacterium]|nr:radical SAM protein [Syntrophaceae bacterium]
MKLKICEIFKSIQGESSFVGWPCLFVRVSGCNMRCKYCDTNYAWNDGREMSINEIIAEFSNLKGNLVLLTGGEPLLQQQTPVFLDRLIKLGYTTLVETNGSLDIAPLPADTVRIVDIKCPGSGESERFYWDNLKNLRDCDEVKFVITDRSDFEWCKEFVLQNLFEFRGNILMSPAFGMIEPKELVSWILESN